MNTSVEHLNKLLLDSLSTDLNTSQNALLELQPILNGDDSYLLPLQQSLKTITEDQLIITVVYAIRTILSKSSRKLSLDEVSELHSTFLNLIQSRSDANNFSVATSLLVELDSLLAKIYWFESPTFMELTENLIAQAPSSDQKVAYFANYYLRIMVDTFSQNHPPSFTALSTPDRRKVQISFRDLYLPSIFASALCILYQASLAADAPRGILSASLIEKVLDYDFLGSNTMRESQSDDSDPLPLPNSWSMFFTPQLPYDIPCQIPVILLQAYQAFGNDSDVLTPVLNRMCALVSIRRSIFPSVKDSDETDVRYLYLTTFMDFTLYIGRTQVGMNSIECYHAFCRFLLKFKSSFTMRECVKVPMFIDFLSVTADVTAMSLRSYADCINSLKYLFRFWMRVIQVSEYDQSASSPDAPVRQLLNTRVPEMIQMFITQHLNAVLATYRDNDPIISEDPLDPEFLAEFTNINVLFKYDFNATVSYLAEQLDNKRAILTTDMSVATVAETAWLIHLVNYAISSRLTSLPDEIDGALCAKAFLLVKMIPPYVPDRPYVFKMLEIAIIAFLQSFRTTYVIERSSAVPPMYAPLQEANLGTPELALSYVANRAFDCIPCGDPEIVTRALKLLSAVTNGGYSSSVWPTMPVVVNFIQTHSPQNLVSDIPELQESLSIFYHSIGSALITASNMVYFNSFFAAFAPLAQSTNKHHFICLIRSLSGICKAVTSHDTFALVFEAMQKLGIFQLIGRIVEDQTMLESLEVIETLVYFLTTLFISRSSQQTSLVPIRYIVFKYGIDTLNVLIRAVLNLDWTYRENMSISEYYDSRLHFIKSIIGVAYEAFAKGNLHYGVFSLFEDNIVSRIIANTLDLIFVPDLNTYLSFPELVATVFDYIYELTSKFMIDIASSPHITHMFTLTVLVHSALMPSPASVVRASLSIENILTFVLVRMNNELPVLDQERAAADHLFNTLNNNRGVILQLIETVYTILLNNDPVQSYSMFKHLKPLLTLTGGDGIDVLARVVKTHVPNVNYNVMNEQLSMILNDNWIEAPQEAFVKNMTDLTTTFRNMK